MLILKSHHYHPHSRACHPLQYFSSQHLSHYFFLSLPLLNHHRASPCQPAVGLGTALSLVSHQMRDSRKGRWLSCTVLNRSVLFATFWKVLLSLESRMYMYDVTPSFLFDFALLHLIVQASTSPPCSTQEVNSSPRSSAFKCFMHIINQFQQKHKHFKIISNIKRF